MITETFSESSASDSNRAAPADVQKSVDVAEICGGAGDTAYMLIRRGLTHGLNFDITVGFNLKSPDHNTYMWQYCEARNPTIVLISTPCTGMKGVQSVESRYQPCCLSEKSEPERSRWTSRRRGSLQTYVGEKTFHLRASS